MIKKLIMVGATTQNNKFVNGQSMMFQLFVDDLKSRNVEIKIVDFGNSIDDDFSSKRVSGKFSLTKLIDNFILIFRFLFVLFTNLKTPIYITTSQTKIGFVRDYIFINIGALFGSKIIAHQFGSNYNNFYASQSIAFQKKIKSTLEKTEKIIVEGDYSKKHFIFLNNYQEKVVSITNGLPEKVISAVLNAKTIKIHQPVNLIYLSNLIESKGYWDVLVALNMLVNEDKRDVNAVFSGKFLGDVDDSMFDNSDHAKREFFEYIDKNKLTDRVKYFDGLYRQNKVDAFRNSHFFLLPSYYINEGQPVSILEALAYGCVPIVTEYRLIPDMVNDRNGFFVPPKSPRQIADVINLMIDNPNNYNEKSKAGIEFYLENFTSDKYIDKVLKLFSKT